MTATTSPTAATMTAVFASLQSVNSQAELSALAVSVKNNPATTYTVSRLQTAIWSVQSATGDAVNALASMTRHAGAAQESLAAGNHLTATWIGQDAAKYAEAVAAQQQAINDAHQWDYLLHLTSGK